MLVVTTSDESLDHRRIDARTAGAIRFAVTILVVDLLIVWLIPGKPASFFVSFGVVATLWFMDFSGTASERLRAYTVGLAAGLFGVAIGTLCSGNEVAAIAAAFIIPAVFSFLRVLPGAFPQAVIGVQLGFLLAVLTPAGVHQLVPHLVGWLIGSVIAVLAALAIFPRRQPGRLMFVFFKGSDTRGVSWSSPVVRDCVRIGLAIALAVLVVQIVGVQHGFWVAAVALCVVSTNLTSRGTQHAALDMLVGAVVGLSVSAIAVALLPHAAIFGLLAIAAFISKYEAGRNPFIVQLTYTPFAVFNLAVLQWPDSAVAGDFRVKDVALGVGVAVVATLLANSQPKGPRAIQAE